VRVTTISGVSVGNGVGVHVGGSGGAVGVIAVVFVRVGHGVITCSVTVGAIVFVGTIVGVFVGTLVTVGVTGGVGGELHSKSPKRRRTSATRMTRAAT
jgi:hypothetical protein